MRYHCHVSPIKYLLLAVIIFATLSSTAQTKRAFLVGISNYGSSQPNNESSSAWCNIHGANDVQLLRPTLRKQGFEITSVCDNEATAATIRKMLDSFSSKCKNGDIIYIHFSCHGQPVEDIDGDEDDGWDEAIVACDAKKEYLKDIYTGESHIIDDELNEYFRKIRTRIGKNGYVYAVIDACHAGSSYRGVENDDSIIIRGTNRGFSSSGKLFVPRINKTSQIRIESSKSMSDICLIEACRSYQTNAEIKENGVYYGSLSFYVNEELKKTPLNKNTDWIGYVTKRMSQDPRLIRQNPVVESSCGTNL